jgi:hypothetical protein
MALEDRKVPVAGCIPQVHRVRQHAQVEAVVGHGGSKSGQATGVQRSQVQWWWGQELGHDADHRPRWPDGGNVHLPDGATPDDGSRSPTSTIRPFRTATAVASGSDGSMVWTLRAAKAVIGSGVVWTVLRLESQVFGLTRNSPVLPPGSAVACRSAVRMRQC